MSLMGQYTVLQADIPGVVSENIGVLLVDDSGSAHVKFRRDLRELADEDDAEYLELLEDDLRGKAAEMGGTSLLHWIIDTCSNVIRASDPEYTAVSSPEWDIRRLYKAHVSPKVLPFRTHLPVYTLAAAAGSWGEQMEVSSDDEWIEAPADLRLTEDMFVGHVVGHSMEPRIPAGSLCVFRRNVTGSRQGRLVLVENYGETGENRYTVKRYTSVKRQTDDDWEHQVIRLEPLNPEYEAWELSPSDIRVVGEFVRVLE
jgi:SOS-response transcriptional repressor LexA